MAQLAGYVSEHAAYHHGEASLAGTIVGLAQDFVGSNNINLLVPSGLRTTSLQAHPSQHVLRLHTALFEVSIPLNPQLAVTRCCAHMRAGQFGSRVAGGKDASSPRYIFTRLAALARHVFNKADDCLLSYLNEEGLDIEPEWCVHSLPCSSKSELCLCGSCTTEMPSTAFATRCRFGLLTSCIRCVVLFWH